MGAKRYSCPIRLVPTYILPAKEIRHLGKFKRDIYFMGSESSPSLRCKLLIDINIPSARVSKWKRKTNRPKAVPILPIHLCLGNGAPPLVGGRLSLDDSGDR